MNIENPEKQKSLIDQIFELEKQLDQMRAFIQANEQYQSKSENLRNRVEYFKEEIKKRSLELIRLRLKYKEEGERE